MESNTITPLSTILESKFPLRLVLSLWLYITLTTLKVGVEESRFLPFPRSLTQVSEPVSKLVTMDTLLWDLFMRLVVSSPLEGTTTSPTIRSSDCVGLSRFFEVRKEGLERKEKVTPQEANTENIILALKSHESHLRHSVKSFTDLTPVPLRI